MPLHNRPSRSAEVCLANRLALITAVFVLVGELAVGQSAPAPGPNSDPTYQALRNITLGGDALSVSNLDLKRDAATFHLHSGTVCFVAPVQGKVTGAVFVGEGSFALKPPSDVERRSLKLLSRSDEFNETFTHLVLRFTDSTYDELKKAGTTGGSSCDAGLLKDSQNAMRHSHEMKYNLDARILADVLRGSSGQLFVAFVHGKRYNDKELFVIDPHGAPDVAPEDVELMTYDENKTGIWTAFRSANSSSEGVVRTIQIEHHQLETTIEKSGNILGKATTTFISRAKELRAVPFDLFPSLRVQSVVGEGNQPLAFIQEDKHADSDFWVILPKTLSAGEKYTIITTYGGKEAVTNEGNGNYFPVARDNLAIRRGDRLGSLCPQ